MIYELRIYHAVPGRLADVHHNFEHVTLPLWERHGIVAPGFFTTLIGPTNQSLTYLLKWTSLAERETKMAAFAKDPDWIRHRAAAEANGVLVARIESSFLTPTSYSAMQ